MKPSYALVRGQIRQHVPELPSLFVGDWHDAASVPPTTRLFYIVMDTPVELTYTVRTRLRASIVVTPTEFARAILEAQGVPVRYVIPHGIDPSLFDPVAPPSNITFLHTGGSNWLRKEFSRALEILAVIAQQQPVTLQTDTRCYSPPRGVTIQLLSSYREMYPTAHLCTSLGEGFGLTSFYSALRGAAQFLPDNSVHRELWGSAATFLRANIAVRHNDTLLGYRTDLAAAAACILTTLPQLRERGEIARAHAERFLWPKIAPLWRAVCNEVN